MTRPAMALVLGVLLASCGGGSIDDNPEPGEDVFDRVAAESAAIAGLRFTHQYASTAQGSGTQQSTVFGCPNIASLDEQALRDQATSSSAYRVCFQDAGDTVCEYPGTQALRESVDDSTSHAETVVLRVGDAHDTAIFFIGANDDGQPQQDLVAVIATERDAACNAGDDPGFVFDDLEGTWSLRGYAIDEQGAPALLGTGTFTCAQTSCTGSSGISMSNVADSGTAGDGLMYEATMLIAGAGYADTRAVLSKSKRTLAALACPSGVAVSDMLKACRYVIGQRQP